MRVKDWASLWARLRSATAGGTERGPGRGLDVHAGVLTAEEVATEPCGGAAECWRRVTMAATTPRRVIPAAVAVMARDTTPQA